MGTPLQMILLLLFHRQDEDWNYPPGEPLGLSDSAALQPRLMPAYPGRSRLTADESVRLQAVPVTGRALELMLSALTLSRQPEVLNIESVASAWQRPARPQPVDGPPLRDSSPAPAVASSSPGLASTGRPGLGDSSWRACRADCGIFLLGFGSSQTAQDQHGVSTE